MVDLMAYTIVALIGVFAVIGVYLIVRALRVTAAAEREAAGPRSRRSLGQRVRDYVGASGGSDLILSPPLRVGLEFVLALCGFPGLGWLSAGHLATGLALIVIGPSVMWAIAPVLMSLTGGLMTDPFVTVRFLPVLAFASAGSLALVEARSARARARA